MSPRSRTRVAARALAGHRGLALVAILLGLLPTLAPAAPPRAVVLAFELIDDRHDLDPAGAAEHARTARLTARAGAQLAERGIYRVVDPAPAAELIARHGRTQSLLRCNGCETDIARALAAERVVLGWVHKVSNLILSVNLQVRDGATGRAVWQKSADIRGNTDQSWQRGLDYLLDRLQATDPAQR